jgi:VCBS repeat protein
VTLAQKSLVRFATPVLLLPVVASIARGQVFQYDREGNADSSFGLSVNRVGDIDKDGYEDFIVGTPSDNVNNRGGFIVFSGASGSVIVHVKGGNDYAELGWAVDGRLDLDNDNVNDVLVGAPFEAGDAGSVLAYSPQKQMKLYKLAGPSSSLFGTSVRSLEADLDGDGIRDFIVGAPGTYSAYVYSGATGTLLFSKTGQSNSDFGHAVSRAGDLDGDGICDFLVGSPKYTDASLGTIGRVSAFSGATGTKLWSFDGPVNASKFGNSIAEPGDLDGDGVPDCIVGAPGDLDSGGVATGSVTVISGATGTMIYKVTGDAYGDMFGWDVRSAGGDIDLDGVNDVIVGAIYGHNGAGYARTLSGATGATLNTYVEHTVDPSGNPSGYGMSVASGDFNNDGRPDLLIGDGYYNYDEGLIEIFDTAIASWRNYGAGWPGTLGIPFFTASNNPFIGQSISFTISNSSLGATPGLLLIGVSQASIPTGKGGTLLVNPSFFLPLSIPSGSLTLTGSVPNDPSIAGLDAYLQVLELDAGASNGLSFTPGLDLFFGFN